MDNFLLTQANLPFTLSLGFVLLLGIFEAVSTTKEDTKSKLNGNSHLEGNHLDAALQEQ